MFTPPDQITEMQLEMHFPFLNPNGYFLFVTQNLVFSCYIKPCYLNTNTILLFLICPGGGSNSLYDNSRLS